MVFAENPLELRQWINTDGGGQTTTGALGEVRGGGEISITKFLPREVQLEDCAKK